MKRKAADNESSESDPVVSMHAGLAPLTSTGVDDGHIVADEAKTAVESSSADWSYYDQRVLAPMVRVGTLPMRLLAAEYGATMCYSEEIIDRRISSCVRVENKRLGTINFESKGGGNKLAFQTIPGERVVFQVGTADAVNALKAAEMVCRDVRAIDVNMGCPEKFSTQGGMGSALLRKPEVARDILSTLVRNMTIPVTCKIRLLEDPRDTLTLVKILESTGIRAIGIHARYVGDRPARHIALYDQVPPLVSALSIPVIYNGDAFCYEDFARLRARTHAHSVMTARGAMWNASMFRPEGPLPVWDVARRFLDIAIQYENNWHNSKYILQEMVKDCAGASKGFQLLNRTKDYSGVDAVMEQLRAEPALTRPYIPPRIVWQERPAKVSRTNQSDDVVSADIAHTTQPQADTAS